MNAVLCFLTGCPGFHLLCLWGKHKRSLSLRPPHRMHQRFIFYTIGFEGESLKEAPFLFDFDLKKKKKKMLAQLFFTISNLYCHYSSSCRENHKQCWWSDRRPLTRAGRAPGTDGLPPSHSATVLPAFLIPHIQTLGSCACTSLWVGVGGVQIQSRLTFSTLRTFSFSERTLVERKGR